MKEKVSKKFGELYGSGAILFASPGRINLIGEHTDYNGGFVFPGAVDKGIVAAIKINGTDKVRAYALDLGESAEFGLNEADKPAQSWASTRYSRATFRWAPACLRRRRSNRLTLLR